jgi:hypothetical protein
MTQPGTKFYISSKPPSAFLDAVVTGNLTVQGHTVLQSLHSVTFAGITSGAVLSQLNASNVSTGTLDVARGGTGVTTNSGRRYSRETHREHRVMSRLLRAWRDDGDSRYQGDGLDLAAMVRQDGHAAKVRRHAFWVETHFGRRGRVNRKMRAGYRRPGQTL